MNQVAINFVAATMNQNQFTTTVSKYSESNSFNDMFTAAYENNGATGNNTEQLSGTIESDNSTTSKEMIADASDKSVQLNQDDSESFEEKVKELVEEVIDENGELKVESEENAITDNEIIEEAIMEQVAMVLDIPVEELVSLLEENNMGIMDMFDGQGLKEVLMEVYNLTSDSELLQNQDVLESFKELKDLFSSEESTLMKKEYQLNDIVVNSEDSEELLENIMNFMDDEDVDISELAIMMSDNVEVKDISYGELSNTNELNADQASTLDISSEDNGLESKIEIVDLRDDGYTGSQNGDTSSEDSQQGFAGLFENAVSETMTEVNVKSNGDVVYTQIDVNEILDQVVTKVKVELGNNNSTMSMQLTPDNLGKVSFTVSSENGNLTGSIVAENSAVKEALEMNIALLKANLDEQGIKVNDLKVVVGNTSEFFERNDEQRNFNNQQSKKTRKILNLEGIEDLEELEIIDNNPTYTIGNIDNSVEFSA